MALDIAVCPDRLAGLQFNASESPVGAADEDLPVQDHRRGKNGFPGLEFPFQCAVRGIQGVYIAVRTSEYQIFSGQCRGGVNLAGKVLSPLYRAVLQRDGQHCSAGQREEGIVLVHGETGGDIGPEILLPYLPDLREFIIDIIPHPGVVRRKSVAVISHRILYRNKVECGPGLQLHCSPTI